MITNIRLRAWSSSFHESLKRHTARPPPQSSFYLFQSSNIIFQHLLASHILHFLLSSALFPILRWNWVPALKPPENMVSPENNSNWVFDYCLLDDIPVPGGDLPPLEPGFQWPINAFPGSTGPSTEYVDPFGTSDGIKEYGSRKRVKSGSCSASDSKACREKMRRDRLNDRFQELSSILEPGRPPKMDKAVILSDAVRMVNQLRDEAKKLKESHEVLQDKINELKAEKNELRDEKQKLKVEKEKLEQQMKDGHTQSGFLPSAVPAPFVGHGQVFGGKMVPFVGYPGVPMWQFTPPATVDTTQDHVFHAPVA